MFNLITTLLICLGMSNIGMPISNYTVNKRPISATIETPKKANENTTTTYTLNIDETNDTVGTTNISPKSILRYRKRDLNGSNSFLQVYGNLYQQETVDATNTRNHIISNYDNLMVSDVYNGNKSSFLAPRLMYVMQITPYQFNVETTANIKLVLTINGTQATSIENDNTYFYSYKDLYVNVRRYNTVRNDWTTYIGKQNNMNNVWNIETDIININNGYYYSYKEETIKLDSQGTYNNYLEINDEITITPQTPNYYVWVIESLGQLNPQWYEDNSQAKPTQDWLYAEVAQTNYYWMQRPQNTNPLAISGTNVIPSGTYEVIDVPGIMFEILGMPFSFISTAFNLTLFPNTPYQVNIANLFLAIISLFVFIFLIKIILKFANNI